MSAVGTVTPVDNWRWRAHHADGTAVDEVAPDGRERGWAEALAAGPVVAVELTPVAGGSPVWLEVPPGASAALGRRRTVRLVAATGATEYDGTLTFIAWHMNGRSCWVYLRDDGTVAVTDRPQH